jgi:hypothetical protein
VYISLRATAKLEHFGIARAPNRRLKNVVAYGNVAEAADLTLALDCLVSRLEGEWDAPPIKRPQSAQA